MQAFTTTYQGTDQSAAEQFLALQAVLGGQLDVPVHTAAPAKPRQGRIVVSDGTSWNPIGAGVPRLVWYNGTNWVALNA